jgi:hypothetical protein
MSKNAPIAFFAYKRPEHTRRALEALMQNDGAAQSELFIFCEGPKRSEDQEAIQQVRDLARSKQWCGSVQVIERETNLGCANSIIAGVTEICEQYARVIVIEDDLVISPFFLDYMNQALAVYENSNQVMQISGYNFLTNLATEQETIFLPFTSSWGWATWQRAWKQFDPEMLGYAALKANKELRYKFDVNDSFYYFSMLEAQIDGKIDAWDIRWYLTVFMLGGLVLYPTHSLVSNTGFDGSGTHYRKKKANSTMLADTIYRAKVSVVSQPLVQNTEAIDLLASYLRKVRYAESSLPRKLISRLLDLNRR